MKRNICHISIKNKNHLCKRIVKHIKQSCSMKRNILILAAVIAATFVSQDSNASMLKHESEKQISTEAVIQQFLNEGFEISSATTEKNTFKSPEKSLKKLKKWTKKENKPKRNRPAKAANAKTTVFYQGKDDAWTCKYKKMRISFNVDRSTLKFVEGSERSALDGTFIERKWMSYNSGDIKAEASGNSVSFTATPVKEYRVVIGGKVLAKKQLCHEYLFVADLASRKVTAATIR